MMGEHIRALKRGRWNHAIDCGDETVVHLANEASPSLAVRRSYRPEFVSGAEVVEVVTHRERTFPADEVVARAYSRIGDPALAAMFRSSESFAAWCTTGRPTAAPGAFAAGAAATPPVARTTATAPRARAKPAKPARPAKAKPKPKGRRTARRAAAKAPRRPRPAAKKAGAGRAKPGRPRRARATSRKRR
jgi:lecithin:retinol acyltransferase